MHLPLLKKIKRSLTRALFGKRCLERLRAQRTEFLTKCQCRRNLAILELREKISRLPVLKVAEYEIALLPKGKEIDLQTCPFDTWFLCTPHTDLQNLVVVGRVVPGTEAFLDQYGSGMSVPERFINRYRIEVEKTSLQAAH